MGQSQVKVIAIEPVESNFKCLRKAIDAYNLGNAPSLHFAADDRDGQVRLSIGHLSGLHSAVLRRSALFVTVPMRSVVSILAELGLERADLRLELCRQVALVGENEQSTNRHLSG